MTFDPARPRYTLPFAGKEYDLLGTFELIEAVETALKLEITKAAVDVVREMTAHDLAKLVSAVLTASGTPLTAKEAGAALWNEIGLAGDDNTLLRLHLYAFLTICLAKPGRRAEKAKEMGELIGELRAASRGATTSASA